MKKILILLIILAVHANAQEAGEDSSVVNIERKELLLTVVSWPFVHIVQPTVEFLMYPLIPPLMYVSRENLIEKGQNLITYGENNQIMFYPLINAKIGSSANIGFAYRHAELFSNRDFMFFSPHLYINGDWDAALQYQRKRLFETSFYSGLTAGYREKSDDSSRDIIGNKHFYADSSVSLGAYLGFNLSGSWNLEFGLSTYFYRFDISNSNPPEIPPAISGEYARGFYTDYNCYPLSLSLLYNTLDEPYAATKGSKFSLGYTYAPVSAYDNSNNHNYHVLESRLAHYSLLGSKTYAMTVAESNINRERLKHLTFSEAIEMLNPINIKENILDRRVLITQVKARYMIEEHKGRAPFTAMGRLGGNFPLRAYEDGYFTAPLIAGISAEYRWPIDRYVDALIFNEYGVNGENFDHLFMYNIKNSYGFGFRVRTPKLFITRFAIAFHGLQGIALIFTTRPEYD